MRYSVLFFLLLAVPGMSAFAQTIVLRGAVSGNGSALSYATVTLLKTPYGTKTDTAGNFALRNIPAGSYTLSVSALGHFPEKRNVILTAGETMTVNVELKHSDTQLNEVVVTGVSRSMKLRSNPVPIVVMSKKQMEQHVNNNIIDAVIKGVPGVTAVTTGPNISKPFIRGLGYNRVLTLYDGVRQEGQQWGDEHGIEIDQYGVARAEVIKGPASLTYGSDALAGVINLIPTVGPADSGRLTGDVIADYHTNNGLISNSLGLAYASDGWKYLFRATSKMAHNYQNSIDGYVYNTAYRERVLSAMVRKDGKWGYSQWLGTLYDNKQEIPDGSRDSLSRRFTRQVNDGPSDDIKNRPVVQQGELDNYMLTPLHQHIQHYRLYSKNQLNIGGGVLSVTIGAQQSIRREYNHPTQPRQAGLYVVLNTLNYDVQYAPAAINGFETSIGINGIAQGNRSKAATDIPIPDHNLFDAGAFIFVKRTIGKADISGGLRYDLRYINWPDLYIGPDASNGFEKQTSAVAPGARLQFPHFDHWYHGVSYSLGATYNLSERVLLKANVARGYRAPNITEIGSNGLDPGAHIVYLGNRSFKPEFNLQEDVGLIAYLKDADLMVEAFNNQVKNYIYQSRLDDDNGNPVIIVPGNTTYQYQQSKARLYGFELTLNLHPSRIKWLALNNSVAYVKGLNQNDALIRQSNGAAKYLPFIPPLHVRSQMVLKVPGIYGPLSKLSFSAEADIYAAQNNFYALNDTETATAGYTLINAGLNATVLRPSGKPLLELFIQADNVFNRAYQSNLNRLKYFEYYAASPNGRSGIYSMGRNLSFKVIVPF